MILSFQLVLLPRLEDIGIFTSADTLNTTKQAMQECWDVASSAFSPVRDSDVCETVEFSLMSVLYNGAIGKFVMPSVLCVIQMFEKQLSSHSWLCCIMVLLVSL